MTTKKSILDSEQIRQNPYSVPDGYFLDLNRRLSAVTEERKPSFFVLARPYIALVAGFALILVCGTALLKLSGDSFDAEEQNMIEYAYFAPSISSYYSSEDNLTDEELTYQEIEDYLISTGTSVEQYYTAYYESSIH